VLAVYRGFTAVHGLGEHGWQGLLKLSPTPIRLGEHPYSRASHILTCDRITRRGGGGCWSKPGRSPTIFRGRRGPMRARRQHRFRQRLDPAIRLAIARASGARGGRVGGRVRALRMTSLERSVAAMLAVRVRWAQTTPEERRWWSDYMRAHQRRFRHLLPALPPRPVRDHARARMASSSVSSSPARQPIPPPIPVIVIPQRTSVVRVHPERPGVRYNV